MVRNEQLPPISGTAKTVADFTRLKAEEREVTQADLAKILGKARSYVSIRLNGLKTWSLDDIDAIAPALGYRSGMELIYAAGQSDLD